MIGDWLFCSDRLEWYAFEKANEGLINVVKMQFETGFSSIVKLGKLEQKVRFIVIEFLLTLE